MEESKSDHVRFSSISGFAKRYLETYYTDIGCDEVHIATFIREQAQKLPPNTRAVEIGCGPTVHHALALAPHVESIDMMDILPDNLGQIELWKNDDSTAFSWGHYTALYLESENLESSTGNIADRENLLRQKMGTLAPCDITDNKSCESMKSYDLVSTFYCAEEVGTSIAIWKSVMANISSLVAPGGWLWMTALRDTDKYALADKSDEPVFIPCTCITEGKMRQELLSLGFDQTTLTLESIDTPELEPLGIPGILLVAANKPNNANLITSEQAVARTRQHDIVDNH